MYDTSARPRDRIEAAVETYGNLLFRICLVLLGNESDAEDAVQDTIVQYLQPAPLFKNPEHEKAWLITVATNKCRDMRRFYWRHPHNELCRRDCKQSFHAVIVEHPMYESRRKAT